MFEGKASLIVDFGNSETRVITQCGKTRTGKVRKRVDTFSNKFSVADTKLLNNPDYSAMDSKVFICQDTIFCTGRMCDVEKGSSSLRPSVSIKKYNSNITLYSMQVAFLTGYNAIAEMYQTSPASLEVEWDVSVLLPPSDMDLGEKAMRDLILGIKEINFLMPVLRKEVKITSVKVFPEGLCAFVGECFISKTSPRPGFKDVIKGSNLIIDIGAGTTDLCIVDKAKLVDGSRYSEETGGNQVFQRLNIELRKQFGKNFPEDSLRKAAVDGYIQVGAKKIDIRDMLNTARKSVATKLSSSIRNYIESSEYSPLNIGSILICGGGSIGVDDTEDPSMLALGYFLKEDLSEWMSYSEFLDIPEQTVMSGDENDSEVSLVKEKINPRLLNVMGAAVLSE